MLLKIACTSIVAPEVLWVIVQLWITPLSLASLSFGITHNTRDVPIEADCASCLLKRLFVPQIRGTIREIYLLYVVFVQLPVELESQLFDLQPARRSGLQFWQQAHYRRFPGIKAAPDTASGPGEVHIFLVVNLTHPDLKQYLVCSLIAQGQLVDQV